MDKDKIAIILEEAYPIYRKESISIHSDNGLVADRDIIIEKKRFIRDSVSIVGENLVEKISVGYPVDDFSEVVFKTDFVIINRSNYDDIVEYINRDNE